MALKKCKECDKEISADVKVCPQCGKPQRKKTRWGVIIATSLFLFTIIIIFSMVGGKQGRSISVGEMGVLDAGGELTPIAVDEAAFDAWTSATVAKDEHGRKILLASMRVIGVPRGTKVLVIDRGVFTRKVRVVDGKQKGVAGWVAMEFVK